MGVRFRNSGSEGVFSNVKDIADRIASTTERLSSGLRVMSPSDDPGGFSEATKLKADAVVYSRAAQNGLDAGDLFATAEDAAQTLYSIVGKIAELADVASNLATRQDYREVLDEEAQQLVAEYQRVVSSTSSNGQQLLNGSTSSVSTFLGSSSAALSTANFTQSFTSTSLTDAESASSAYLAASSILYQVATGVATIQASGTRLESAVSRLLEDLTTFTDAAGRITDVNEATENASLAHDQIIEDAGLAMVTHSVISAERVLTLLGGDVREEPAERSLESMKVRFSKKYSSIF